MSTRSERRPESPPERARDTELELAEAPASDGTALAAPRPAPGAVTGIDDVRAPLDESPSGGLRIRRRELLVWGGAAAMLPALSRVAYAQDLDKRLPRALAPLPEHPMSVGFVEGSDGWRKGFRNITAGTLMRGIHAERGAAPQPATVVPASAMVAGDQTLANEIVRVHVHGLYPVPNPLTVKSAYLTVLFPTDNPARNPGPLPFIAWGYKSIPVPDPGHGVGFNAGLGPTGELAMQLDVYPGRRSRRDLVGVLPEGRFTTSFTVDWFEGRPRLQRGLYLLGLTPDTWANGRELPLAQKGHARPLELLSLMVSFEPIA